MDEGHECNKSHVLCLLTDRLQIVMLEDVVCATYTATVTITVVPSLPYILVQKEKPTLDQRPIIVQDIYREV